MQILFFVRDLGKPDFEISNFNHKERFINCAVEAGFEVVITSWENVLVRGSEVFARRGIVKTKESEKQIQEDIKLDPFYINQHVNPGEKEITVNERNVEVFSYLLKNKIIKNNKINVRHLTGYYLEHLINTIWTNAKVSFDMKIGYLGKWTLEECFQVADKKGIETSRPKTLLVPKEKMLQTIEQEIEEGPMIAKAHFGTRCEGIFLISPENYKEQVKKIMATDESMFVLQRYLVDTVLYNERKIDMRIYVGVFSWKPLKFKVYRHGLTRISDKKFNLENFEELENSISTISLLNGNLENNLTIQEYFGLLDEPENEVWEKIEKEVETSLQALLNSLEWRERLNKTILLYGYDFILSNEEGELKPYILEINHFPTLYRSVDMDKGEKINPLLDKSYTQFFTELTETLI